MRHLSVDVETYSSVNLADCGAYKYAESEDFEVLLFGYSVDFGEPKVIDLACGEDIPMEIVMMLFDPTVRKHAFNAAFEWITLSRYFKLTRKEQLAWARQWHCTMIHAYYLGYAGNLDMVGKAVGLPEDKQKLATGKALIRYFSCPVKATKANGGRTRNLPHHDPEKWKLYKEYNRMDVVAETNIYMKLKGIPVPDFVWEQWFTDLKINSRGVYVDTDLVYGALAIDEDVRNDQMDEFRQLTGLANPASNTQLLSWVTQHGVDMPNMQKATVADTLKRDDLPEEVREALELKKEVSKTSIKKYNKILDYLCNDNRIRGLLQFYGASTTGRYCLTGDHEVLTPYGWVRLDAWDGGLIAVWNPTSEVVSFQKSKALNFPYEGDMIEYSDTRIRQISTPDHKMYCKKNPTSGWSVMTVEEMTKSRPSIPFFGYKLTVPCGISDNELRVLIMVQADATFKEDGYLVLHFTKERKVERCKKLLRKAGIVFSHKVRSSKSDPKPQHYFSIARRNQPLCLRMFRDRTFGWWLLNENADTFFDELPNWDGYNVTQNSMQYSTVNKQNADVIQALAHMSGRACSMLVKKANGVTHKQDAYVLNIWSNPTNQHEIKRKPNRIPFAGTVYCAETNTGFFLVRRDGKVWVTGNSGRGVQLQNLPRTYLKDIDTARALVKQHSSTGMEMLYDSVSDTLSQLIRTAFIPSPGNVLLDADFSAIEARVIGWLAGEEWVLEEFRGAGKIYEATASQMFGVPKEQIKKGTELYKLRQQGKVAQLACSYGGGVAALTAMDFNHEIPDDMKPGLVKQWRAANPHIVAFWSKLERACIDTIKSGTSHTINGRIRSHLVSSGGITYLQLELPNKRSIYYCEPHMTVNRFGNESIGFYGKNQVTGKWEKQETYAGKLAENATQSVARDLLAESIERLEANGFEILFHIHDEVVIDYGGGDAESALKKVYALMSEVPKWAKGLPMAADGWVGAYFKKD